LLVGYKVKLLNSLQALIITQQLYPEMALFSCVEATFIAN
jgi:hypothetical protein